MILMVINKKFDIDRDPDPYPKDKTSESVISGFVSGFLFVPLNNFYYNIERLSLFGIRISIHIFLSNV